MEFFIRKNGSCYLNEIKFIGVATRSGKGEGILPTTKVCSGLKGFQPTFAARLFRQKNHKSTVTVHLPKTFFINYYKLFFFPHPLNFLSCWHSCQ